jgi:NADPH-dependent curcumin reductase CurA
MPTNKQIVLDSRPADKVSPANFRTVESPIPHAGEGQIVVRHHYLSLDPYMRGRLSDAKSYAKPQELGAVMGGGSVGEVVESKNPKFKAGDFVVGMGGWQQFALSDGAGWNVVDGKTIPLSAYLGVVGMPGVTAWYGLNEIIAPKAGETVVVSAASGAVGGVVGQLAKLKGARVVGIAGGAEKCGYVRDALGFDACVDHRSPTFAGDMKAALPQGLDGLFENVGGEPFLQCLKRINDFGRIAVCGLIASYETPTPTILPDMRIFLVRRIKIEGFIVADHPRIWPKALAEIGGLVASGRLKYRETVREGLEATPQALVDLLHGGNFGKMLVKLV